MTFVHPGWLWGVLVLPLFYAWAVMDDRKRRAAFEKFADPRLWDVIAPELDPRAKLRKALASILAIAFALLALARPQWGEHEEVVHVNGLDVMLVLDASNSMETEDVIPSRLKKAKHLIRALTERLRGDRVGLVGFAAEAAVTCPLTTDMDYLMESVDILTPQLMPSQGTDIGVGLETALKALERGGEDNSDSAADDKAAAPQSRAIILITDGEDHEGKADEVAEMLKQHGVKLYVLGVGTQKGGPIPMRDSSGNLSGYKKDHSGQPIVSTFHPDELLQLAALAGGRYWNVTMGEGEVDEIAQDMGGMNRTDFAERRFMVKEDRFQYPLAIAILFFLLELSLPARRLTLEPGQQFGKMSANVASRFFPAARLGLLLLGLWLGLSGRVVRASPVETYIENEKGVEAYKKGDIDQAKQNFGKAQALDPSRTELEYNQGLVQLQEGKMDDAIRSFGESAAKSLGNNPDLASRSLYNMGVAEAKKGDVRNAVRSYLAAITEGSKAKNPEVDQAARKNLELLMAQEEQKKQQQQQQQQKEGQQKKDQQGGGQQSQDQQQQQQQQQQKDQSGNQGKDQNQPKQYAQNQKQQKFKSEKLSPEDAERVVSELANKEKDLQTRLKTGKYGRRQDETKDW